MELDELKQQWDILHKELDKQQIINRRLMENAVRGKIKSISNENWRGLILVIFTIPFIWIMQHNYKGLDTNVFYFGLLLMFFSLLFSIYSTFFFDKVMKKKSILEREKGLLKFKKINFLEAFYVIKEKGDYLRLVKYDPSIINDNVFASKVKKLTDY